jgi:hypothetical protein
MRAFDRLHKSPSKKVSNARHLNVYYLELLFLQLFLALKKNAADAQINLRICGKEYS